MADQDQPAPETGGDLVLRANGEVALRETDGTEIVLRPTGEVRERNADSSESVLRPNGEIAARDADGGETVWYSNGDLRERDTAGNEYTLRANGEVLLRDTDNARTDEVVVALMRASDRLSENRADLREEGEYLQQLADYLIGEVARRAAAVENRSAGD